VSLNDFGVYLYIFTDHQWKPCLVFTELFDSAEPRSKTTAVREELWHYISLPTDGAF